ncbi:transcription elongation factor B polypeptide 3 isoform X2 [Cucumis melo var. makuwa]|uniref:Transcription elongation factor B polypeptide 3 isoform X2 n=1 Tax=Cucumis melo var. makuwa TaxID=1194695 RepID=A0A5A7ULV4_CUCMM|nr:transcription elongation factor B polypeptide 3 isoform X2 [Cucumis melo var. makuwa]
MYRVRKIPSLVDLCVNKAIDNIRFLGDVGETDIHLLERILPHCTVDQLMHVEKSSEGRDLTPVTDKLWKKFYERQFGKESTTTVIERMRQKRVAFRWIQLYEAKMQDIEKNESKAADRIKQSYLKENARIHGRSSECGRKICIEERNGERSRKLELELGTSAWVRDCLVAAAELSNPLVFWRRRWLETRVLIPDGKNGSGRRPLAAEASLEGRAGSEGSLKSGKELDAVVKADCSKVESEGSPEDKKWEFDLRSDCEATVIIKMTSAAVE